MRISFTALAGLLLACATGIAGAGTVTASKMHLDHPEGVATDSRGNVYIADSRNLVIRKITPDGKVSNLAGKLGFGTDYTFYVDGKGDQARLSLPLGLTADSAGNLYLIDYTIIRKITPAGVVTTVTGPQQKNAKKDGFGAAVRVGPTWAVAVDRAGNLYYPQDAIHKVTPDGVVTDWAGKPRTGALLAKDGPRKQAVFASPAGIAVGPAGNFYVADGGSHTIRKITPAGMVSTLAGTAGQIGDADGTGPAARFNGPFGIAVDRSGKLYVTDRGNGSVRKITPGGVVTTLATTADGFHDPSGIAVDPDGNVYVADTAASVVRKISAAGKVTVFAGTPKGDDSAVGGTLCRSSEQVLFSCHATNKKIVSVCASRIITSKRGYIQYRYGRPRKIELSYPATQTGPAGKFRKQAERWARGSSQTSLAFTNGQYTYTVYADFVMGTTDDLNSDTSGTYGDHAGVYVDRKGKSVANIHCGDDATSFNEFDDAVPDFLKSPNDE